jgi:hypothetical protein
MATWLHTCGHCTVGSTLDGDRAQFVHTSSSRWPAGRTPETSRCGASVAVLVSPAAVPASRKVQRECCGVLVRQLGLDGRVLTLPRDLILYMCASVQQVESNSDKSRALIYFVFWPIICWVMIQILSPKIKADFWRSEAEARRREAWAGAKRGKRVRVINTH